MMNSPEFLQQMSTLMSNPAVMDQIIASNPQLAAMGPQVREAFQSEQFRQMMCVYFCFSLIILIENVGLIRSVFSKCSDWRLCFKVLVVPLVVLEGARQVFRPRAYRAQPLLHKTRVLHPHWKLLALGPQLEELHNPILSIRSEWILLLCSSFLRWARLAAAGGLEALPLHLRTRDLLRSDSKFNCRQVLLQHSPLSLIK